MKTILLFTFTLIFTQAKAYQPFEIQVYGNGGKAVVLIPGYASSPEVWNETIEALQSEHRLYVLHFAGFAGKPAADDPTFKSWAGAVAAWLNALPEKELTVVGHSMGGAMALWLGAEVPEKVAKIVVVDALPCLAALNNPNFEARPNADCSQSIRQMSALSDSAFKAMQQQGAPWLVNDAVWQEKLVKWSMQSDRHTLASVYCSFMQLDLRPKLAQIKAKVLVQLEAPFTGYQSAITAQYAQLKDVQLAYAPKGLHFVMVDAADWYFESLHAFLKP